MRARVPAAYKYSRVRACAGAEFVKGEWRPVPLGQEPAALIYARIEDENIVPALEIEPEQEPEPKRGKKKAEPEAAAE